MKPAKKPTKKISATEIKYWLAGVLEMQPADWTPNAEQWKLVKEKIMALRDDEPVEKPRSTDAQVRTPETTIVPRVPVVAPAGPSSLRIPQPPNVEGGEYNNPYV